MSDTWLEVIELMKKRRLLGLERYGEPVHSFNRRNSLMDAFEEVLDLSVYIKNAIEERQLLLETIKEYLMGLKSKDELRSMFDKLYLSNESQI